MNIINSAAKTKPKLTTKIKTKIKTKTKTKIKMKVKLGILISVDHFTQSMRVYDLTETWPFCGVVRMLSAPKGAAYDSKKPPSTSKKKGISIHHVQ